MTHPYIFTFLCVSHTNTLEVLLNLPHHIPDPSLPTIKLVDKRSLFILWGLVDNRSLLIRFLLINTLVLPYLVTVDKTISLSTRIPRVWLHLFLSCHVYIGWYIYFHRWSSSARWWTNVHGQIQNLMIHHYRRIYLDYPDPIVFLSLEVDTKKSDQFWFLRTTCLSNRNSSVGLILSKTSDIRISIPLDLSSRSFIPLPRFIRSRHSTPLLAPCLVLFPPRSA
jgi:hypothetical protein